MASPTPLPKKEFLALERPLRLAALTLLAAPVAKGGETSLAPSAVAEAVGADALSYSPTMNDRGATGPMERRGNFPCRCYLHPFSPARACDSSTAHLACGS